MPLIDNINDYKGLSGDEIKYIKASEKRTRIWKKKEWENFISYREYVSESEAVHQKFIKLIRGSVTELLKLLILLSPFFVLLLIMNDYSPGALTAAFVLSLPLSLLVWLLMNWILRKITREEPPVMVAETAPKVLPGAVGNNNPILESILQEMYGERGSLSREEIKGKKNIAAEINEDSRQKRLNRTGNSMLTIGIVYAIWVYGIAFGSITETHLSPTILIVIRIVGFALFVLIAYLGNKVKGASLESFEKLKLVKKSLALALIGIPFALLGGIIFGVFYLIMLFQVISLYRTPNHVLAKKNKI